MSLEIAGKVVKKMDVESGTSKNGKEWKKQSIVIETDGQYPKKICFSIWNTKQIKNESMKYRQFMNMKVLLS